MDSEKQDKKIDFDALRACILNGASFTASCKAIGHEPEAVTSWLVENGMLSKLGVSLQDAYKSLIADSNNAIVSKDIEAFIKKRKQHKGFNQLIGYFGLECTGDNASPSKAIHALKTYHKEDIACVLGMNQEQFDRFLLKHPNIKLFM